MLLEEPNCLAPLLDMTSGLTDRVARGSGSQCDPTALVRAQKKTGTRIQFLKDYTAEGHGFSADRWHNRPGETASRRGKT